MTNRLNDMRRIPDMYRSNPKKMTVLTDVELIAVVGGLNPQPLPPRVDPHDM
jgi:hypothetical protein